MQEYTTKLHWCVGTQIVNLQNSIPNTLSPQNGTHVKLCTPNSSSRELCTLKIPGHGGHRVNLCSPILWPPPWTTLDNLHTATPKTMRANLNSTLLGKSNLNIINFMRMGYFINCYLDISVLYCLCRTLYFGISIFLHN